MGVRFEAMVEALETPEAAKTLILKVREAVDSYIATMPHVNNLNDVKMFGGCPECHENHKVLYSLKGHLFGICKKHRKCWDEGSASPVLMTNDEILAEEIVRIVGFTRIAPPWKPDKAQTELQENDFPF